MTVLTLKAPENSGGFSHAGKSYTPDEGGHLQVPPEAAAAAYEHGFTAVEAVTAEEPPADEPTADDAAEEEDAADEGDTADDAAEPTAKKKSKKSK